MRVLCVFRPCVVYEAILVEISVFQAFPESQRVELRSQRESYGPLTSYIIDTAAHRKEENSLPKNDYLLGALHAHIRKFHFCF